MVPPDCSTLSSLSGLCLRPIIVPCQPGVASGFAMSFVLGENPQPCLDPSMPKWHDGQRRLLKWKVYFRILHACVKAGVRCVRLVCRAGRFIRCLDKGERRWEKFG